MATAIRILETPPRAPSFTESLETQARDLTKDWSGSWYAPESTIVREISLTLEFLKRRRSLKRKTLRELSEERFYTYGELVQQKRETWYRPYRPNSIEQLKAHLQRIDRERRNLESLTDEQLSRLHDRLLYQLNKLAYLRGGNGSRNPSEEA